MLKPLVYYDQTDIQTIIETTNLFWKPNLVCPILELMQYVCSSGQWYNYWTNDFVGGKEIWVDTKFDEIPVFIKGAIIPKYPVQQYVVEN
jgi:alpha-glucosidase